MLNLKVRLRNIKNVEKDSTFQKPYKAIKIGNLGIWFLNDKGQKEYAEFKDLEQKLENGKWERII